MPVNTQAVGKTYEPTVYAVGREKIKEYALAVGETEPLYLDLEAARAAGYADLVAPPMFAVVYASPSVGPALFDPDIGINFAMMVHGGQEFEWGSLVVAGDEITTTASVKDIADRARPRLLRVRVDLHQSARRAGVSRHLDTHRQRSVSALARSSAGRRDSRRWRHARQVPHGSLCRRLG